MPTIYGLVSLVLLALALTFALSSPPPTTPPMAAVAPAPQEQVEVERVEQSSRFGEGAGAGDTDCAPGNEGCEGVGEQPATQPTAQPSVIERSAAGELRSCVNGPGGPRQTDDPQSPPCKAEIFTGDNGGATWTGVTRSTVRIAVPPFEACWEASAPGVPPDCSSDIEVLEAFAAHVNAHYELYERRIELVPFNSEPGDDTPASQRAYAADLAAADVFAVLDWEGSGLPFYQALVDHRIVALHGDEGPVSNESTYDRLHPYVWGVYPATEQALEATGALICGALVARPARHAGPDVAEHIRHFAIIQEVVERRAAHVETLVSKLDGCNVDPVVRRHDRSEDDEDLLIENLRRDGVTTIICVCASGMGVFGGSAEDAGYEPEWLVPGLAITGNSQHQRSSERTRTFGLVPSLREPIDDSPSRYRNNIRLEQHYWFTVLQEERPGWRPRRTAKDPAYHGYRYYAQFLMLASGLQWAGPNLTPETFAAALQDLTYPNPGVGQQPWYQPSAGFGPGDHTFNSDFALAWWDATDDETGVGSGRFCYVGGGARFTARSMPTDADELLFDPEAGCR